MTAAKKKAPPKRLRVAFNRAGECLAVFEDHGDGSLTHIMHGGDDGFRATFANYALVEPRSKKT